MAEKAAWDSEYSAITYDRLYPVFHVHTIYNDRYISQ